MIPVERMAQRSAPWLLDSGPEGDHILSTRVRLARNLRGVHFVGKALEEDLARTWRRITDASIELPIFAGGGAVTVGELPLLDRQFLLERHLISHDLASDSRARGLVLSADEGSSIMVNEEDHLRIQALSGGLKLEETFEAARTLDEALAGRLDYAWTEELGYLTACPTNVGTGMRASVLLHLPALVLTQKIKKILTGVGQVGLTARGFYGEGTDVVGNFFQLSNQVTLGEDEGETLSKLARVVRQILDWEEKAQERLLRDAGLQIEDKCLRALGVLQFGRLLSSQELIALLSAVRLGHSLGLRNVPPIAVLNDLLVRGQPAHLQKAEGREMSSEERNERRARMVQETLRHSAGSKLDAA